MSEELQPAEEDEIDLSVFLPQNEDDRAMAPASLREIRSNILRQLREALERDPEFVTWIEGLLAEKFPRRDEFARLLEEVQAHRAETKDEFQRVDQRLEQIDQHLEQIDQHFTQVDQHLENIDQRLDNIDQRLDNIDQRFEQVDQRFEQVDQRFEQVDQRFEQVDQRFDRLENEMRTGFTTLERQIDRLGARWGIRNEKLFRQTMRSILESSFEATVQEYFIGGEQFDCLIINGDHILVEITASAGRNILTRLQRKRQLYIDTTGVTPIRFILAVGSIHSKRAESLRAAGFDVIEPEEEEWETESAL